MPQPIAAKSKPNSDPAALKEAFEALRTYCEGSSRAALLPIDEAVIASLNDKATRSELEQRLVAALLVGGSVEAREFICAKLVLIGSERAVPALSALLSDARLATPARTALEAIASPKASEAMRKRLPRLSGLQKVGAIHSIGARRDAGSERSLAALLRAADVDVAGAALGALGEIGSAKAANALCAFAPKAPEALRPKLADATLVCAERLLATGQRAEAQALARMLDAPEQPEHVRQAAARLLSPPSGKR
jgi:hypothetical protein